MRLAPGSCDVFCHGKGWPSSNTLSIAAGGGRRSRKRARRRGSTMLTPPAVTSHTVPSWRRIIDGPELPLPWALDMPSISS
ncbi:hypothetical protein NB689_003363 [Xanthomonas sacchari]|nr:hypothetical protein [Xanthomonas sacchari]